MKNKHFSSYYMDKIFHCHHNSNITHSVTEEEGRRKNFCYFYHANKFYSWWSDADSLEKWILEYMRELFISLHVCVWKTLTKRMVGRIEVRNWIRFLMGKFIFRKSCWEEKNRSWMAKILKLKFKKANFCWRTRRKLNFYHLTGTTFSHPLFNL